MPRFIRGVQHTIMDRQKSPARGCWRFAFVVFVRVQHPYLMLHHIGHGKVLQPICQPRRARSCLPVPRLACLHVSAMPTNAEIRLGFNRAIEWPVTNPVWMRKINILNELHVLLSCTSPNTNPVRAEADARVHAVLSEHVKDMNIWEKIINFVDMIELQWNEPSEGIKMRLVAMKQTMDVAKGALGLPQLDFNGAAELDRFRKKGREHLCRLVVADIQTMNPMDDVIRTLINTVDGLSSEINLLLPQLRDLDGQARDEMRNRINGLLEQKHIYQGELDGVLAG